MEQNREFVRRTPAPRRRRPTKFQIFKEVYLPLGIAGLALLMILIIIIGSVVRAFQTRSIRAAEAYEASLIAQAEEESIKNQAKQYLEEAAQLAKHFDYEGAIATLEQFTGDRTEFPELADKIDQYRDAWSSLVLWEDTQNILCLSFQTLIADPDRAYSDSTYGSSYKSNFVTTEEFFRVLEELYGNDYILVSTQDCFDKSTDEYGNICIEEKPLYLPAGKKPLILTQTNVCYNLYMVDSDGDLLPDAGGAGFANRLELDENGNLSAAIVHADGTETTGSYDLVPILESFIQTHPDFSYKGAKAILALTGFNGIFGYRTNASALEYVIQEDYDRDVSNAVEICNVLRENGYEIACYTYSNKAYGGMDLSDMQEDLALWSEEVGSLIGRPDIFVFAQQSDIATDKAQYSSEKFNALKAEGFVLFFGFSTDGKPWRTLGDNQARLGRILVTADNLKNNPAWFEGILDPAYVLSPDP